MDSSEGIDGSQVVTLQSGDRSNRVKFLDGVAWSLDAHSNAVPLKTERVPTPLYELNDDVYPPSHDTFLLMDSLQAEFEEARHPIFLGQKGNVCVEIGSGTGIIITFIALLHQAMRLPSSLYLATDINPQACSSTRKTGNMNNIHISVCLGNLATPLLPRLLHQVDLLVFNPPYVPTTSEEFFSAQQFSKSKGECINASWAGGINGREILDIFLHQVPQLLSKVGCCYLVVSEENHPKEIESIVLSKGLIVQEIARRFAISERLLILRLEWAPGALSSAQA